MKTDHTAVIISYIPYSVCSNILKGVAITSATDLYHYRAYLESLLTYGIDAAVSHLTNMFWYLDKGDLLPCDTTAAYTDAKNKFIERWNKIKLSKVVKMVGRLVTCNVPTSTSRRSDADKIHKGQTRILLDEQRRGFQCHLQVSGRATVSQARQTEPGVPRSTQHGSTGSGNREI